MFENLSLEQLDRLLPKLTMLEKTNPKNLIGLFDYDLTMAAKRNPQNFDDAPLHPDHHAFLCAFAPIIGHVIVQTARGEKTTLDYLKQYGEIHNLSLASNSGHLWMADISCPEAKSAYIAIPAYEKEPELLDALVDKIHGLNHNLENEYAKRDDCSLFIVDDRELCGAVIYQLKGKKDSKVVLDFHLDAEKLKRELGQPYSSLVNFASKDREVIIDGEVWTQGYIDSKPKGRNDMSGMDKGYTTNKILTGLGLVAPESVLLVAGDSDSDYPMMQLANRLVKEGKARAAICIDVGGEMKDPEDVIDVSFKKDGQYPHSQIDSLYQFLGGAKDICALSRGNIRDLKKASVPSPQP